MLKNSFQEDVLHTILPNQEVKVLDLNSFRDVLIIQNQSLSEILIYFEAGSPTGFKLLQNGHYEPLRVPVNDVYIKNIGASNAEVLVRTDKE